MCTVNKRAVSNNLSQCLLHIIVHNTCHLQTTLRSPFEGLSPQISFSLTALPFYNGTPDLPIIRVRGGGDREKPSCCSSTKSELPRHCWMCRVMAKQDFDCVGGRGPLMLHSKTVYFPHSPSKSWRPNASSYKKHGPFSFLHPFPLLNLFSFRLDPTYGRKRGGGAAIKPGRRMDESCAHLRYP